MLEVFVKIKYGQDSVSPHISMAVLEVLSDRGDERYKNFLFFDFADQTENGSSDILIRMNEVITKRVADEDHFTVNSRLQ
jgi:hypothetical protein